MYYEDIDYFRNEIDAEEWYSLLDTWREDIKNWVRKAVSEGRTYLWFDMARIERRIPWWLPKYKKTRLFHRSVRRVVDDMVGYFSDYEEIELKPCISFKHDRVELTILKINFPHSRDFSRE